MYLAVLTLSPFEFSVFWLKELLSLSTSRFLCEVFYFDGADIIANILLFIPFGMILSFLSDRRRDRVWIPLVAGVVVSGTVEGLQLFLARTSAFVDIFANVGGSVLGYYGVRRWAGLKIFSGVLRRLWKYFRVRFIVTLMVGICVFLIMIQPYRRNTFVNWNDNYRLLMGNEETLNRPWKGELFLVAVYDRALALPEIRHLHDQGWGVFDSDARRSMGAVALYDFSVSVGDTIHDASRRGEPLDFIARNVRRTENRRGMVLDGNGFLRSLSPASKLVHVLKKPSQMTVEVWLRTVDPKQKGPARIVTLSESVDRRNFTLGQDGTDFIFRVRTPLTGSNASDVALRVRSALEEGAVHHVAAIFNRGVERMAVDGTFRREMVRGDVDYLSNFVGIGRNAAARLAFILTVFFPMGLFLCSLSNKFRFLLTVVGTVVFVLVIETFYYCYAGQPFGFYLLLVSSAAGALGGFVGMILSR
ncbi:MAG: VanZ family protein [bacterium]